ncbi:hypothetical protein AAFC00_003219 [Neodothiora populina]|uniref:Microbial-type PARG catalytic domain-containing protein n=1 Tax=Neodothiora populina TaxID=2781224 RepID=A0ABR3P9R0_9PEZI
MDRLRSNAVMRPQSTRRSQRSRKARDTINKVLPDLLKSSPRARHGVHSAKLVVDPPSPETSVASGASCPMTIRLRQTDTLTAARQLTPSSRHASISTLTETTQKPKNVCVLSMASPVRAGGGFLEGATSQEEFLCMRTTLYPSLWDDFYSLPQFGGIITPDVMVHRDSTPEAADLTKRERFFVDVISSSMMRFPGSANSRRFEADEGLEAACSCGVSYCDRDRDIVTQKMRAVLQIAQQQGAERLVLGAWGCGAYGHPAKEVAKIWRRVLLGGARSKAKWTGIKEVCFAIHDRTMLREFEKCFADVATQEPALPSPSEPAESKVESQKVSTSDVICELVSKIQETELQLDQLNNPRSKARLRDVLAELNRQLAHVGMEEDEDEMQPDDPDDEEADALDDATMHGIAASDGEDNSYYNFDSDDVATSGSVSPDASDLYEFKIPDASASIHHSLQQTSGNARPDTTMSASGFSSYDGWFSGSINGLSAFLSKPTRPPGSPVLRPNSSDMEVDGIGMGLDAYLRRFSSDGA